MRIGIDPDAQRYIEPEARRLRRNVFQSSRHGIGADAVRFGRGQRQILA
jgi:hypothetical protein